MCTVFLVRRFVGFSFRICLSALFGVSEIIVVYASLHFLAHFTFEHVIIINLSEKFSFFM